MEESNNIPCDGCGSVDKKTWRVDNLRVYLCADCDPSDFYLGK